MKASMFASDLIKLSIFNRKFYVQIWVLAILRRIKQIGVTHVKNLILAYIYSYVLLIYTKFQFLSRELMRSLVLRRFL